MVRLALRSISLALAAGALAGSAAATAVAAPDAPLASATYGRAEVSVSRASQGGGFQLSYKADADSQAAVVPVNLPTGLTSRNQSIGLGLDAQGLLTVVIQAPRGIYWAHVTRPGGLRRIAKTTGGQAPAIFRGRVAYVCQDGTAICKASLRTKARRVLHREPAGSPWRLFGVRIGAADALGVESQRDGALGASRVQIKAAGKKPRTVADANLDGGEAVLLHDVSPAGDHLTVLRRSYAPNGDPAAEPTDRVVIFTLPGGRKVV